MTTEEQANADALWPNGTDVSGLRAMIQGLLSAQLLQAAVYIGTANVRGILVSMCEDAAYWKQVAEMAPAFREALRTADAVGAAMDAAERKAGPQ